MTTEASNPMELLAAFNEADTPTVEPEKKDEPTTPATATAGTGTTPEASDAGKQIEGKPAEPEPDGVATRDGKHVIPYAVLKSERDKAAAAQRTAQELQAKLDALTAVKDAAAAGTEPTKADVKAAVEESNLSDEEIAQIAEDFPALGKFIKSLQQRVESLATQLTPVVDERSRTAADEVQDAIDANAKLAHIQAEGGDAWTTALEYDKVLRARAVWQKRPLAERFAEVVRLVEAELGTIDAPQVDVPAPKLSRDELAAAAAKVAVDKAKGRVPTSLTDLKAGDAPHVDELSFVETASPTQLAAKFASMSPDQLDSYLFNQ